MKKMTTNELLSNMRSGDKDFRYMAVSDMTDSLKKGLKLEQTKQKELAETLVGLLGDINGEVRNLSVIGLGELARGLQSEELAYVVGALMKNLSDEKRDLGEVSSLALKGVASAVPSPIAVSHFNPHIPSLCKLLNPHAIPVDMEILETLALLLPKLGKAATKEALSDVEGVALRLLESGKFKQRARTLLETLLRVLPSNEYERLATDVFLVRLEPEQKDARLTARYVMAVGCACRADRQHFAALLDKFIPKLVALAEKITGDHSEELIEACLQALESSTLHCQRKMRAHKKEVARIACEMIHCGDTMEVDEAESSDEQPDTSRDKRSDSDNDDDEEEDADEEDPSWRVRRAASKCLEAMVSVQAEELEWSLRDVCPLVIRRLSVERSDLVKLSLLDLCSTIVKQLEEEVDLSDNVLSKREESLIAAFSAHSDKLLRALNSLLGNRRDRKMVEASLQLLTRTISFVRLSPSQSRKLQQSCESIAGDEPSHSEVKSQAVKALKAIANSNKPKEDAERAGRDLPSTLLPSLKLGLESEDPKERSKSIAAFRALLVGGRLSPAHEQAVDEELPHFLAAIGDPEIEVKRCAILTLNTALQNRPKPMRELLPTVVPLLYAETKVKPELLREIEMGPFKSCVDDGLELRKSAFECMYTLGDKQFKHIDFSAFLNTLLADTNCDIRKLVLLIVSHASVKCPNDVSDKLDSLSDALMSLLNAQLAKNAIPGEAEKLHEVKRSAMSTYNSLKKVPFASESSKMSELSDSIDSDPALKDMLRAAEMRAD